METNKEIPTAEELFVKYSQYLQFEEGGPEYFIDKEDFKQALIEYTKCHLSKQAEVIAEKAKVDYISTHSTVVDRESIFQASEEYINNLK